MRARLELAGSVTHRMPLAKARKVGLPRIRIGVVAPVAGSMRTTTPSSSAVTQTAPDATMTECGFRPTL